MLKKPNNSFTNSNFFYVIIRINYTLHPYNFFTFDFSPTNFLSSTLVFKFSKGKVWSLNQLFNLHYLHDVKAPSFLGTKLNRPLI